MKFPDLPHDVQFLNVPVGKVQTGTIGVYNLGNGTIAVTGRVSNDDAGVFRVTRVETDKVIRDPDAPSGHISLVLEVSQVVDGPGPISVNKLEAVIATVAFSCPADPTQDTFQGTIVFDGLHSTFSVVGGSNAQLTVGVEIDPAHTFLAFGETKEFPFKIESSLGHDADVILQCDQAIAPSFRACPRS